MKQSPSQQAKQAGLNSLAEVSRMTNVSAQTLTNWCKSKPQLFDVVVLGCATKKQSSTTVTIDDTYFKNTPFYAGKISIRYDQSN